jgi:hypothetical protein
MKITDNTPFRNESGQIDLFGRVQGTLKFGLSWFAQIKAQDTVIAVLEKILNPHFILLRNITLPDTDIDLPIVLVGPPGIYLVNVTPERGVYQARDDEWGSVSGEKFVPAATNVIQRTVKLARVLQLYLDRAGYKGSLVVEPILMAADPGMHIESVRAAARVVMSDALEIFAISMNQARPIYNTIRINDIAHTILNGPHAPQPSTPAFIPTESAAEEYKSTEISTAPFEATDDLFDRLEGAGNLDFVEQPTDIEVDLFREHDPETELANNNGTGSASQSESVPASAASNKKGILGMSTRQLLVLGAILIFWFLAMLAFFVYIYFSFNA